MLVWHVCIQADVNMYMYVGSWPCASFLQVFLYVYASVCDASLL